MKAVIFDRRSTTEKLRLTDTPTPSAGSNDVLVAVRAASINAADYRMLSMGMPPRSKICGADVAGVVVSVGDHVTDFKPGDSVVGELSDCGFGGFAEYVAAPAKAFVVKPESVSFEQAAALPLAATTALRALQYKASIRPPARILIIGASGGVGSYAIQIAGHQGFHVTAVCSERNVESARKLGANEVFGYVGANLPLTHNKYDLILLVNGNYKLRQVHALLNPKGRLTVVGGSIRQIVKTLLGGWMLSLGDRKVGMLSARTNAMDLRSVLHLVSLGMVQPVIDRVFPLADTPQAFRYLRQEHARGKIVITMEE